MKPNSTHHFAVFNSGLFSLALACSFGLSASAQNQAPATQHPNVVFFEEPAPADPSIESTASATFVEVGKPTGGYKCIVDMALFNGRMYLSTADDPLGNWGAKVFYTTDAITYTQALSDGTSQGYLRMGVFDNQLWIPDGDPNGMDPGYVYISNSGNSGSFTKTTITGAVHTFDVIKFAGKALVANGMSTSLGGLSEFNGSNLWSSVSSPSASFRMKYMAEIGGKLWVANANPNSDVDYFLYTGSASSSPQSLNKVTGSGSTYQIYTTSQGKMFWTVVYSNAIHVLQSTDGTNWTPSPTLDGKFVSDFAESNGILYALDWKGGLWESSDHNTFTVLAPPPANAVDAFGPLPVTGGYNADARASMLVYNGSIYCGSSTNGKVYKVDITTSASETAINFPNYYTTENSMVLTLENKSDVSLRIFSLQGALVQTLTPGELNTGRYTFDLSELQNGLYLIEATVGHQTKGIKFMRR